MFMENKKRISIFIDQANLWSSCKKIWKVFDFSKFRSYFEKLFEWEVKHIFFYQAYPKDWDREYNMDNLHKFFVKLEKWFWFKVRKKPLKTITLRDKEWHIIYDQKTWKPATIEKWNFDVELSIDAQWYMDEYDIWVFFSWDSDFLPLINLLKNNWKSVYVFSSEDSISKELKSSCNKYFDIIECTELHWNDIRNRKTK